MAEFKPENPYPESAFPPMDLGEVADALIKVGISPDRAFGNWGRYVWDVATQATLLKVVKAVEGMPLSKSFYSINSQPSLGFEQGTIAQRAAIVRLLKGAMG